MLEANIPAVILAPMDGLTDAPMRDVQGEIGAYTFAVSEFVRVSTEVPPMKVFHRDIPELLNGGRTRTGLPVAVQILGGDPERMAQTAHVAVQAGAWAVDINFGCPAPTVNRHDGGATLLKYPARIRDMVAAVRSALPATVPVSAKLRLGWDSIESIHVNAAMAAEGGASWITIHGRTRLQGYQPPAHWEPIGVVRETLSIPVVANGDIWTLDNFKACRDTTGCIHYMLGRGGIANPHLSHQVARELGVAAQYTGREIGESIDWPACLRLLVDATERCSGAAPRLVLSRLKQWLKLASHAGAFADFDAVKRLESVDELLTAIDRLTWLQFVACR